MLVEPSVFVEVTRGPIVESVHYGAAAVADPQGTLVAQAGDPAFVSYYRSASKPIQAIPLVESGAAAHFGLTPTELAVVTGSHGGEDIHVAAVQAILAKIGARAEALHCGIHVPYDKPAAEAMRRAGAEASALHNNCSGKHAGMLALARFHGWPLDGYWQPEHPVQQAVRAVIADFCGVAPEDLAMGVDGCSVITFGTSIRHMATSFARLVDPPAAWPAARRDACRQIVEAMAAYPEMVAGRHERLDTDLMQVVGGRIIAKAGAEAVYCMAVRPTVDRPGLGLALKLLDGDDSGRARNAAVMGLLAECHLLAPAEQQALAAYSETPRTNRRGDVVGTIRPAIHLVTALLE
jgi:L-asparaginase II